MTSERANINDVAREAGVSPATVSRALRNMPHVAASTRSRVVASATALGYMPHPSASSLASGRTWSVGLVAPFLGIWYTGQVLAGIEDVLSRKGYDLIVFAVDTEENRKRFMERSSSLTARVDGLILVDYFPDDREIRSLVASSVDCVAVGELVTPFSSLAVNNERAGVLATEHLIELGHERIGVLGHTQMFVDRSPSLGARLNGYKKALRRAGLPLDQRLLIPGALAASGGTAGLDRIIALRDRPTALFCLSDETAMGVLGRARTLGLRVPEDLSVVGIDDHDLAGEFDLTTVRQPVRDIGQTAAAVLLDSLKHDQANTDHRIIEVRLVVRGTTSGPTY